MCCSTKSVHGGIDVPGAMPHEHDGERGDAAFQININATSHVVIKVVTYAKDADKLVLIAAESIRTNNER